jgi:hypothetical protein
MRAIDLIATRVRGNAHDVSCASRSADYDCRWLLV